MSFKPGETLHSECEMKLTPILIVIYLAGCSLSNSLFGGLYSCHAYNLLTIVLLLCCRQNRRAAKCALIADFRRIPSLIQSQKGTLLTLLMVAGVSRLLWHKFNPTGDSVLLTLSSFFAESIVPAILEEPISRVFMYFCMKRTLINSPLLLGLVMLLIDISLHNPMSTSRLLVVTNFSLIQTLVWFQTKSIFFCIAFHILWNSVVFLPPFAH